MVPWFSWLYLRGVALGHDQFAAGPCQVLDPVWGQGGPCVLCAFSNDIGTQQCQVWHLQHAALWLLTDSAGSTATACSVHWDHANLAFSYGNTFALFQ